MVIKCLPELDESFVPMCARLKMFNEEGKEPVTIAVERENGQNMVFETKIFNDGAHDGEDKAHIERTVKFMLWAGGGYRVGLCAPEKIVRHIEDVYGSSRAFDAAFMSKVYEKPFEVTALEEKPVFHETPPKLSRNLRGCRIGFDAGGSDRKVSAVIDGEAVFSEETVWHPKINSDPSYHYDGILEAFKKAASKMPRVDAIGVSSAGIYVNNRAMVASLFRKISEEDFAKYVKDIYIRAAAEIGAPLVVANDGDVTALAGSMNLNCGNVLGIAMGTSLAGGYINGDGCITGRLNELAFVPVDGQEKGMLDEWSGDYGVGAPYLSQDAVANLSPRAGIELPEGLTPAEKLSFVQKLASEDDPRAMSVFRTIGCYLGHTLAYFHCFYGFEHVLLMGRVMSGKGGEAIYAEARRVLETDYAVEAPFEVHLPDESSRRVGQSVAAAALTG